MKIAFVLVAMKLRRGLLQKQGLPGYHPICPSILILYSRFFELIVKNSGLRFYYPLMNSESHPILFVVENYRFFWGVGERNGDLTSLQEYNMNESRTYQKLHFLFFKTIYTGSGFYGDRR